jgi:hypothetical protein
MEPGRKLQFLRPKQHYTGLHGLLLTYGLHNEVASSSHSMAPNGFMILNELEEMSKRLWSA